LTYIVSWTATVQAETAEKAVDLASADLREGNIAAEVEPCEEAYP
jgi:hypothetical protein